MVFSSTIVQKSSTVNRNRSGFICFATSTFVFSSTSVYWMRRVKIVDWCLWWRRWCVHCTDTNSNKRGDEWMNIVKRRRHRRCMQHKNGNMFTLRLWSANRLWWRAANTHREPVMPMTLVFTKLVFFSFLFLRSLFLSWYNQINKKLNVFDQ